MKEAFSAEEIWSIDRINGDIAILESDSGRMAEFWAWGLPPGAKEGDVVRELADGSLLPDKDETAKRRKKNADLFNSLTEKQVKSEREKNMITYEDIKNNNEINIYIKKADEVLLELGFTEHSFPHVTKCAVSAGDILKRLGHSERETELSRIAGYMHDIGNVINRHRHAETGAIMVFRLLDRLGMEPAEIAAIISAIGNHDESTGAPVNAVAAALILADKCDVRRSRVRNADFASFDIHDRVNYAVESSSLEFTPDGSGISLRLKIDSTISAVMDYFEIFLQRMLLCRRAANFLGLKFGLEINGVSLL